MNRPFWYQIRIQRIFLRRIQLVKINFDVFFLKIHQQVYKCQKLYKFRTKSKNSFFSKIALNRVLTCKTPKSPENFFLIARRSALEVPCASSYGRFIPRSSRHRISVSMSYISFSDLVEKFNKFHTKSKNSLNFILSRKIHFFKDRLKSRFDIKFGIYVKFGGG